MTVVRGVVAVPPVVVVETTGAWAMSMLLAQPLRTPMKWSLKVPIDFFAKFI